MFLSPATVMSLKRLLVGSISLSDNSQLDEENGREGPESQDQGLQGEEGGGMKREEEGGISAPLVLSQERMEEVRQKLQSLEVQLKRLQVREGGKEGRVAERELLSNGVAKDD